MKYLKPGIHKKQKPTKQKDHKEWVASQGCMICGGVACVHHIRILGEPRDDMRTIPLCYDHHQGSDGIHFLGKHVFREIFGHELDMLAELMERKTKGQHGID